MLIEASTKSAGIQRKAVLALLLVTVIWGFTFVWMKQGLQAAQAHLGVEHAAAGIALFMALRFGLAAAFLATCVPAARRGLTIAIWRAGAWLGALLFVGFMLQMFGLRDVTPAVSAFLTSLYVLFTASISALLGKRGPSFALVAGVLLATLGAGFIRGRPELAFNLGEVLTLGCALLFALHILATDRLTTIHPPLPVTLTSFAWVAVASSALLAWMLVRSRELDPSAVLAVATDAHFVWPMMLSSMLATVLALSLMNVYQRELDPVRAAILYALEPIWATIAGIALGLDTFSRSLWIGGAVLLAGNLVAELGQSRARQPASAADA